MATNERPVEIRDRAQARRMLQSVRRSEEGRNQPPPEFPDAGMVGSGDGDLDVFIKVTGSKNSYGFYPARFTWRRPAGSISVDNSTTNTGWYSQYPDPPVCMAQDPNNLDLKSGKRYRGKVVGLVAADGGDKYPLVITSGGGGGGDVADSDTCGWLLYVPQSRIFKLTVLSGFGICGCFDTEQGLAAGDVFYLIQNPEPSGGYPNDWWVGTRTFHTCCGCGRFLFYPVGDGTAQAKILINQACDAADPAANPEPYEYDLTLTGCSDGSEDEPPYALFSGSGFKNCNGDDDCNCRNNFVVKVECLGCCEDHFSLVVNNACRFDKAARSYFHDTTGVFSGDYLAYNGQWTLAYDADASDDETGVWTVTCGETDVTITMTIESVAVDADGYGIQVTLLYEGAAGGSLTYAFGPVGRPTGTSTLTFREYDCQELTFMLSNLVYDGTPPTGAPATAEHLTALVCKRFVCCTGPGPDIGVGESHSINCLDITVDNAHVVIPGDSVDCNMDITAEMESTGAEFEWTSGNPFISDTETGGSCIGAAPGGADVGVSYTLACTSDGWRLYIVVAGSSIGTDFNTYQTVSTGGICPDPFALTFPAFSATDGVTGDSYSHDGVTISLCPVMMAPRGMAPAGQPAATSAARKLPARPPCRYELEVVKECKTCGGNSPKKERRHVRKCGLPDNPTGLCSREYTRPEEELWACDGCEYNTALPDYRRPGA